EAEVRAFLEHLAERVRVSASTQNQAVAALLFLYEAVLGRRLAVSPQGIVHAKELQRLPVVLSREEVRAVLAQLRGVARLVALLLYGSGLRLLECLSLRVKDVDFHRGEVRVRGGKGGVDRVVPLPLVVQGPLADHLARWRARHGRGVQGGGGRVPLPGALGRKVRGAADDWARRPGCTESSGHSIAPRPLRIRGGPRLRLRAVLGCGFRSVCRRPAVTSSRYCRAVFKVAGLWLGALARLRFSEEQASGPKTSRII